MITTVIKRKGDKEEFDVAKITDAVTRAYNEVREQKLKLGIELEDDEFVFTKREANKLWHRFNKQQAEYNEEEVDIETIQDWVVESLRDMNAEVHEAYILHRNKRKIRRDSISEVYYTSEFLPEWFLKEYPDYPAHMSGISKFVFLRTYSRDIPELKRRETWKETCIRSVDHNIRMDDRERNEEVMEQLRAEAIQLFDMQFNLRGFLSGRALFTGGSNAAKKYPLSLFNCSFIEPKSIEDFGDVLYLLSVGAGVGYRNTWDVVDKLPLFKSKAKLVQLPYLHVGVTRRIDDTEVISYGDTKIITVGDSKEGWKHAVIEYLKLMTDESVTKININYNNVRPEGAPLKTFGGHASGPEPLRKMFDLIHEILTGDYCNSFGDVITSAPVEGKLRPVHVMHIANAIASAIVVGGVRRAAMISLFSRDDKEMTNIKRNFDFSTEVEVMDDGTEVKFGYNKITGEKVYSWQYMSDSKISHLFLSNNTAIFEAGYIPTRDEIVTYLEAMKTFGEPGFMNEGELIRRNPEARGANPCFEILLQSYQTCNLVTLNTLAYVFYDAQGKGHLDLGAMTKDLSVLTRSAYRVTLNELELPHWNETQEKQRLLGVSPTAWMDMIEATQMNNELEAETLTYMYEVVRKTADHYADMLGYNRSENVTAVKPSGSLGILANATSPGVHASHSPFHIRRIQISKVDPLYEVVRKTNWHVEDYKLQPDKIAVISFPIKSTAKRTKFDIGAIEQLDRYKRFQQTYTDQNTSITVSVQNHEWDEVADWLVENWNEFTGVSFLPLTDHKYDQAPYEDITEEKYLEMVEGLDNLDHEFVTKYMDIEKRWEDIEIDDPDCTTGACASDRI